MDRVYCRAAVLGRDVACCGEGDVCCEGCDDVVC